jgi:flagellar biosynthesis activator protein FlaF
MQSPNIYLRTTDLGGASAQEAEILAFGLCNNRMQRAADAKARIDALHQNHLLWSALVRDLAAEGNALPADLKRQLIELGMWSMRYGTQATVQNLPLTPLIEVNRNLMDGLKAQVAAQPAATRPPVPAAETGKPFMASA